jgi:acyl-CoA thioesterase FadM
MVSRWPVVVSLPVAAPDCDQDGRLTDASVERLFAHARAAYFARCATVDATRLQLQRSSVQRGRAAVGDEGVTVSVTVAELFSDRFTMTARLRPVGPADGDGVAATAWCSLSPDGREVPAAMRDEFIALAHSARHIH